MSGSPSESPRAPRRPVSLVHHQDERVDDWYWLRDKDDPAVQSYLQAENDHTDGAMAHTEVLQAQLFDEFRSRIQETDLSVPVKDGAYWYYSRTVEGLQYPIFCRKHGSLASDEQVLLDQNELAEGHDFHAIGAMTVSPDHSLLAWSEDVDGDEAFTLRVRDLGEAADLPDEIPNTYYGVEWANDDRTLFYTVLDDSQRPWQLWRHRLGTESSDDVLVHQEDDDHFHLSIDKTRSEGFLLLNLSSMVTSEVRYLPADDPDGAFRIVEPRRQGLEYSIDHHGERFFVVTNAGDAVNFKLCEAPVDDPGSAQWREVIPHRDDVKLDGIDAFASHLLLYERAEGATRLAVRRIADGDTHVVGQPEEVATIGGGGNPEFDTTVVRYGYQSMVTPGSLFSYDMDTKERTLLKQQPVLGGYDPAGYETGRAWATAADGVAVPITYVHRRGLAREGSAPCLLYGYGSYEASTDPWFSPHRLSLLERGFVFAIAHVRGGGELGRRWYEDGKLLHKRNTFTDFLACAEALVDQGFTSSERLAIRGGSAGGLLVGAAVNLRPDLFAAVVAEVPFVDCLTTILDEDLPLSVLEWEEWGDPNDADIYHYMKSYSPYDNVAAVDYPPMLVTGGLNDPRVSFWEPAKWVAKLRATKTDANRLLLKTEMGAGHMGPSGRYEAWREEAFVYAFLLDTVGSA